MAHPFDSRSRHLSAGYLGVYQAYAANKYIIALSEQYTIITRIIFID